MTNTEECTLRADIQRDLNDARALLEQAVGEDEVKKYRKAAEIILLKALRQDPDNAEVKVLLQYARGLQVSPEAVPVKQVQQPQVEEDIPFTAAPALYKVKEKKRRHLKLPIAGIAIVVLAGGFIWRQQSVQLNSNALAARPAPAEPSSLSAGSPSSAKPPDVASPPRFSPEPARETSAAAANDGASSLAAALPSSRPDESALPRPESGTLVVNSLIPAEIYLGERRLGTTPINLKLQSGRQTLEYRSGDLRTVVTHFIKPNDTVSASISFQTTVQINARPWAQVHLDGPAPQSLGQTPLSGVKVPVGGVLVFEHPNFPSKSYRVTESDKTIQVNFP
jgi:hypothetical protein